MNKILKNKIALITGASKGIGAGIAKAFALQGAKVIVNYNTNESRANKLVQEIVNNGGAAIAVQADVSQPEDVNYLFDIIAGTYGALDILVNNAGVLEIEHLESLTLENLYKQININLVGNILSTQQAVELMRENGSIINISATSSINPMPGTVVFSSTKAAIDNITKTLAKELGAKKIRVNTLAPGMTETDGSHEKGFIGSDFEIENRKLTPLGRIAQPDDIAKVAVFLASDSSGWVTGERIQVSGGLQ